MRPGPRSAAPRRWPARSASPSGCWLHSVPPQTQSSTPPAAQGSSCVQLVKRDGAQLELTGIDTDPVAAWRAAIRLRSYGASADVRTANAMDPASAPGGYGTVMVDPPHEKPWQWVTRAADLLVPRGTAVVTVPFRALSEVDLDADVVSQVAGVIGLPESVRAGTTVDLALIVLTGAPAGQVRFVSGRDLIRLHKSRQKALDARRHPSRRAGSDRHRVHPHGSQPNAGPQR